MALKAWNLTREPHSQSQKNGPAVSGSRKISTLALLLGDFTTSQAALLKGPLSQGQLGDRDPEWRTGHVVESGSVEELHGIRVSPVCAADTDLGFLLGRASTSNAHLNQFTHTLLIEISEWVIV